MHQKPSGCRRFPTPSHIIDGGTLGEERMETKERERGRKGMDREEKSGKGNEDEDGDRRGKNGMEGQERYRILLCTG